MIEKEIRKGRENYKNLLEERKRSMLIQEKLSELEKNPYVMEYMRLLNEKNSLIKPEDNIAYFAFDQVAQDTVRHDYIYFYMGCSVQNNEKLYHYYNLETLTVYTFNESDHKEFEDKFTVLFPLSDVDRSILVNDEIYKNAFEKIRNGYFEDLVSNPKEECVKKLKLQYKNSGKDI